MQLNNYTMPKIKQNKNIKDVKKLKKVSKTI